MRRLAAALFAGIVVAGATHAQPHNTDVLVCGIQPAGSGIAGDLLRLSPTGQITTVVPATGFGMLFPNNVAMLPDNVNAAIAEVSLAGTSLLRVWDPVLGVPSTTLASFVLAQPQWIDHAGADRFLAVGGSFVWTVATTGGATTIASAAALGNLHSCAYDLFTGGYLCGDIGSSGQLRRLAPDGTLLRSDPVGAAPFSMDQDHRTGNVLCGSGSNVYEIDAFGAVRTILGPAGMNANALTFDRASGNGDIVVGSATVYRLDLNGVVIATHPGFPGRANAGMCFDRSRNVVFSKVASPNKYRIDIHDADPGAGGRPFILALSITGFTPGIPLPGGNHAALTFDDVTKLSLRGQLAPLLQNNIGTLDPFGRASASLDLAIFGSALKGVRVWAVAVTFNGAAFGMVSKPVVVVLE